jgi:alpha-L-rhamnosidase
MRRIGLRSVLCVTLFISAWSQATPVHLRTNYRVNPLGIDDGVPHFSWQSDSTERNWRQSGYQLLVASSPENLRRGNPDVWDSGRQFSGESIGTAYGGPALRSRKRYYWSVRAWDANGQPSQSAEIAWWEMGLLETSDWSAKWITRTDPEAAADRAGIGWIWAAGQDPLHATPKKVFLFHTTVKLKEKPKDAALYVLARGDFKAQINQHQVGAKHDWHEFDREDVTDVLKIGKNTIDIAFTVADPDGSGPDSRAKTSKAALAALLKIVRPNGAIVRFCTGSKWQARAQDDSKWKKVVVVGELGDPKLDPVPPISPAAALLRHSFEVSRTVQSARLYVTALGSYHIFLNGARVGADLLAPGFTDYSKRVQYQTYDVTLQIVSGRNVIGLVLGQGWFGSGMTWRGLAYFFQPPPVRLLAQLEIQYSDGGRDTVVSDESWKTAASAILHSEIYSGETYDARDEIGHWSEASFDDGRWPLATVAANSSAPIVAQPDAPVRIAQTIAPVSVSQVKDAYVFDLGQNIVGWARLKVNGAVGTRVRLRFAERLNPDGSIYTENLRNADAADTYVLRGGGEESFSPSFTFHGFRYVEVSGFPGTPTTSNLTGEVVSSVSGDPTAQVNTASDLVNRMWAIGLWGQRGNFVSIPTDCPQRDERLGWMGDAGVFWRTGSYNFDIDAFSHKFMHDVTDGQTEAGDFTNVAPDLLRPDGGEGAPGWADAGVIIPWTTWMQYGDRVVIERNWDAMKRFMDFIAKANPDFVRKNGVGPNFADWLAPDDRTDKDLLATAYWALVARMMQQMAPAIGKGEDERRYAGLIENIRSAFQKAYIKDDGTVGTGTQTSYVVALYTKMAPESLEPALVNNLVKDIESRNWHLSTGFLGTPFLLFTLADHGRNDVAYRLLLNETYPSWGYMLSKGATTWWERWNGDTGDPAMNSYNHYAFGSVVAWVYRYVTGIDMTPDGAGFHHVIVRPHLDSSMPHVSGHYDSPYGRISTEWSDQTGKAFSLKITIPANATATVYLPAIANSQVTQDGTAITARQESGSYVVETGSGTYEFLVK